MEDQIIELLTKTFGDRLNGRFRLPGEPQEYTATKEVMEVTPLQAMTWIAETWQRYPNGRNFYPTKIEKIKRYAEDMRSGKWEYRPDGDPIVVTDGMITGGRHRLHAILLSGQTIKANILTKTRKDSSNG
jgi:hypothetical protein